MDDPPDQLGAYVEHLYGRERADDGASILFLNLIRIHSELTTQKDTRLALSNEQERSFWILWDWWMSYKAFYLVSADAPATMYHRHLVEGQCYELKSISRFSIEMIQFLEAEFGDISPKRPFHTCRIARQNAADQSACQNVGKSCLRHWIRESGRSHVYVNDSAKEHHLNFYVAQDGAVQEYVSAQRIDPVRKRITATDLSGLDPKSISGASCGSCPWLPGGDELPFYLWDTQNNCTVEVSFLENAPEYVAISHTWGRWRKPNQEKKVSGVSGWTIPENNLFDVGHLHHILSSFPIDIRYVWFDLVCIPQDGSERANIEIARQAAIFKNAKHCMIWLNTLRDWTGLREAVELMAVQCITGNVVQSAHIEDLPTGLFDVYDYAPGIQNEKLKMNGWFTSLWTLQEICLRPDMWLCNQTMELFTVAGGSLPVALNTVAALIARCTQLQAQLAALRQEPVPLMLDLTHDAVSPGAKFGKLIGRSGFQRGYLELAELFDRTGMTRLHTIGRAHILILGSNRFCLENRAEAIMSVLGATRWRQNSNPQNSKRLLEDLILNQYPLEFIREVLEAQGASFFGVISASSASIADVLAGTHAPRGTLLPFAELGDAPAETKFDLDWELLGEEDNPLVQHWKIQSDGSVDILQASIISSTEDHRAGQLVAGVWHTYHEPLQVRSLSGLAEDGRRMCSVDLRDWCKNYFPITANFAVELIYVHGLSRGVLLKELTPGSKKLFKVGNYMVSVVNRSLHEDLDKATVCNVNWTVV